MGSLNNIEWVVEPILCSDIIVLNPIYRSILIKYIHLNPVDAKLVTIAEDWDWSSYRAYLNGSSPYAFLDLSKTITIFKNKQTFISFHKEELEIVADYKLGQIYFRKAA